MATETQARVTNYHALPRSKALRGPFTPGTDEVCRTRRRASQELCLARLGAAPLLCSSQHFCTFFWYLSELIWTQYAGTACSPNSTPSRRAATVTTRSICGPSRSLNAASSCARVFEQRCLTHSLNPPSHSWIAAALPPRWLARSTAVRMQSASLDSCSVTAREVMSVLREDEKRAAGRVSEEVMDLVGHQRQREFLDQVFVLGVPELRFQALFGARASSSVSLPLRQVVRTAPSPIL